MTGVTPEVRSDERKQREKNYTGVIKKQTILVMKFQNVEIKK